MPKEMASEYKFSKYNIYLDESKGLVYNAVTQAVSHLRITQWILMISQN